jgi:hypothetical protein
VTSGRALRRLSVSVRSWADRLGGQGAAEAREAHPAGDRTPCCIGLRPEVQGTPSGFQAQVPPGLALTGGRGLQKSHEVKRSRGPWAQHSKGERSTAWTIPLALFCVGNFQDRVSQTICPHWLLLRSS